MSLYPVNPDRSKPWNDLPELPISAELYRTLDIYEQLGHAKAALARLQGRSAVIPDQGMLINSLSLREAKASSAIENIFTTDDELYRAFGDSTGQETGSGPAKEVVHYREAIWKGYQHLKNEARFDTGYFIDMYRTVKQSSDGIRPPFAQVYIQKGGSGATAANSVYTPPRGAGIIEQKLQNLSDFLNDATGIDPLLKMAISHFQFEAIHPFRDGNGRTGRLLCIHYLTHEQLLDLPILYISRFILDNKDDYYHFLAGISQRGDWGSFLLYMLKAVEVTATLTYHKINAIMAVKEAIQQVVETETDIQRPELVMQLIFRQPYTKVKDMTGKDLFAEPTARKYLNRLTEIGVMERRVSQGHHFYLNLELYNILAE